MIKRLFFIQLIFLSVLAGCKKDETIRTSGTDTIDNTLYGSGPYFANGFSFSLAKKVSSLDNPGPDILLYVNIDNPDASRLTFQTYNLNSSFFKVGDFANAEAAITAFSNLKSVDVLRWQDMADPIVANQVWIFRTGREKYAKVRIISVKNELRNNLAYGECTFQWVFQPDGTLTFPGK